MSSSLPALDLIAHEFGLEGELTTSSRFGNGLINDTYAVSFHSAGSDRRYILQRINHHVFRDPPSLMSNVERVCSHIRQRLISDCVANPETQSLSLIPTRSGASFFHQASLQKTAVESYWRCFDFIGDCSSHEVVQTTDQAYQAARQFGRFQRLVADLQGTRLVETIPDFHNTPKRLDALRDAFAADPCKRAAECQEPISFALAQAPIAFRLLDLHANGAIPERITHNDTKLSNVLIHDQTGQGVCVVDLDTVMPGLSLYDFGDLVRSCISPAKEDSTDLSQIEIRMPVFEALARGFLDEMADVLTPAEIGNLAFAGILLTYEVGIRFLTDHLLGDAYFGARYPGHNLDRARNQFQLVRMLQDHETLMSRLVTNCHGQKSQ